MYEINWFNRGMFYESVCVCVCVCVTMGQPTRTRWRLVDRWVTPENKNLHPFNKYTWNQLQLENSAKMYPHDRQVTLKKKIDPSNKHIWNYWNLKTLRKCIHTTSRSFSEKYKKSSFSINTYEIIEIWKFVENSSTRPAGIFQKNIKSPLFQ